LLSNDASRELDEIEAVLSRNSSVRGCAVVVDGQENQERLLKAAQLIVLNTDSGRSCVTVSEFDTVLTLQPHGSLTPLFCIASRVHTASVPCRSISVTISRSGGE
jgi:hypothetical protein